MITEALDSFLGLNGYIGRHRGDIAHRDIDTIWGGTGFFGLENERLRCILGHLPFAVDFTGYDDKLRTESTCIRIRGSTDKVCNEIVVGLGKADVLVLGHAFGLHDMIGERSSLDTFERNHVGVGDVSIDSDTSSL